MRPALRAALAALIACGPAMAQDAPPPAPADRPEDAVRCIIESECLDTLRAVASRDGETLTLRLRDGTTKSYRDDRKACAEVEGDRCVTHVLLSYLPASGVFVVEWRANEAGGAILVDLADGKETQLPAEPEFSPSGRRFAVIDRNEFDRAYDVSIQARKDGAWVEETQFLGMVPGEYELWAFAGWDGDDRLRLTYVGPGDGNREERVRMLWDGNGWQVLKGWEPAKP